MRPLYRLKQGYRRLCAGLRPRSAEDAEARSILSPQAYTLFLRMSAGDRAHGLCVWRRMLAESVLPQEVAAAALLHDAGKAEAGLSLPYRTAIVILRALHPAWLSRLGANPIPHWRHPFFAHLRHAEVGAERCHQAGCSALTIALVRWHDATPDISPQEPALRYWLPILQHADDVC